MNGAGQWDTNREGVVVWLESEEGRAWSRENFSRVTQLVTVKEDDLVHADPHPNPNVDAYVWYANI
jgi:hypothetical protein